jgi:DNA topoisomerase-1
MSRVASAATRSTTTSEPASTGAKTATLVVAAPDDVAPEGLVYVSDESPGIRREKRGDGFGYRHVDGRLLSVRRDEKQLTRIRRLAIPPAYTKVWICPLPHGHLQATGRDARGRKQYRYHADWRRARDDSKFDRMREFGAALPRIRARVTRDLAAPVGQEVRRSTVIAAIVRLLDTTLVRVGNDEYARSNGSYGLTTLRNRHADVKGEVLRLRFKGKSGITHEVSLEDRRTARIVRRCQALPGQELFQYLDESGEPRGIGSMDVNDYLREASGGEFTAKDFRTWHGSVHAFELCGERPSDEVASPTAAAANRLLARVAARLGNTVAVCRKSYVHPRVLELLTVAVSEGLNAEAVPPPRKVGLSLAERRFLSFLGAFG